MKQLIFFLLFSAVFCSAQNVVFNRVEATHDNKDAFLYKIDPENVSAKYLAEVEIQGFSEDDPAVFGKVYRKAKEIGANSFAKVPVLLPDGKTAEADPANYRLALYYTEKKDIPAENNVAYLFGAPHREQTISVNGKNILLPARSFMKIALTEPVSISTRKFLGTKIVLSPAAVQPALYFQISGFSVNSNSYGSAGINLKSGDITALESSYAQFLTVVYRQLQAEGSRPANK